MSNLEWYEFKGSPSEAEKAVLLAALEQSLAEEVDYVPPPAWMRGELPVLPADPAGRNTRVWRRPATRKVAVAIGSFGGVAASVALAIKMRHHQHPGGRPDRPSGGTKPKPPS